VQHHVHVVQRAVGRAVAVALALAGVGSGEEHVEAAVERADAHRGLLRAVADVDRVRLDGPVEVPRGDGHDGDAADQEHRERHGGADEEGAGRPGPPQPAVPGDDGGRGGSPGAQGRIAHAGPLRAEGVGFLPY
jgi:hypothetical protein